MILAPAGTAAELQALQDEFAARGGELVSAAVGGPQGPLSDRCVTRFLEPPDRHATLARLALMDRVKAAAATAEVPARSARQGHERTGKHSRELVARLALQLHLIKEGIRDVLEARPIEVALRVEPAFEKPGDHQAHARLVPAAAGHVSGVGRQPPHAAHRDRRRRERNPPGC